MTRAQTSRTRTSQTQPSGQTKTWIREFPADDEISRPPWVQREPRLALIVWGILVVLGLYLIRLWQLQFLEGGSWQQRAKQQQTRLVTISPPRGVIYDRTGKILVRNIPAYNVTITPGYLPDDEERERAVLQRLSQLIDVPYSTAQGSEKQEYQPEIGAIGRSQFPPYGEQPQDGLLEMVNEVRWLEPYEPIIVSQNIERELAQIIGQEGGVTLPGVDIEIIPRRSYVYGALTSQILGFLGAIPPESVEEYENKGYVPDVDRIGYDGIEFTAEDFLRGTPGRRVVIKDVLGQELSTESETLPHPGDNVHLTLDVELQQVAEDALRAGMEEANSRRGALVILDPRNGEVLSLISLPTYDNNMFSKRLDLDEYQKLLDDPHHPFYNHAIADQIPPGSTFKVIPAAAGLQEGVINRYTTINCPGQILLPNKFAPDDPELAQSFYCWINLSTGGGHGPLNVVNALAQSCDIFFYEVGGGFEETEFDGLGVERLAKYAQDFGLGARSGIDLPAEQAGLVPDAKWKRQEKGETWTTGNTYNLAIGQGDLLVTPLQMANVVAVVANGGTLYRPRLIHHITDAEGNVIREFEPEIISRLPIDASVWAIVQEGMQLAATDEGTALLAQLKDLGIKVAGKTGTAEYCDMIAFKAGRCDVEEHETLPTHAWFIAYAPAEAPEIAIAIWIYDGGEGSAVAAPVSQKVMDFYFRRALGLPLIDEETPPEQEMQSETQVEESP
ncbi:MAG: penicillin-binding protein 2 [Anaerolineae bacterium]|nr:penicillin-binding protein 2 [Anaerolineae bacterium]